MMHEIKEELHEVAEKTAEVTSEVKSTARKALGVGIWIAIYVIVVLVAYLVASFVVKDFWSRSWLIPVAGLLLGAMGLNIYYAIRSALSDKYLVMRLLIAGAITDGLLATYFLFSVIAGGVWDISWILFLFLPILLSGADLIACIGTKSKWTLPALEIFVMTAASMSYIIFGITQFMPWHPGWLLPVIALLVAIIIALVALRNKLAEKKK